MPPELILVTLIGRGSLRQQLLPKLLLNLHQQKRDPVIIRSNNREGEKQSI